MFTIQLKLLVIDQQALHTSVMELLSSEVYSNLTGFLLKKNILFIYLALTVSVAACGI